MKKMDLIFKTDFHVNKNYYLQDYILFFTEVIIRSSSESSRFQKESAGTPVGGLQACKLTKLF